MENGSAKKLKRALQDVRLVLDEPQWDVTVFCRFLAERVPDDGMVAAADLARHAEELIEDLAAGIDRHTGEPFRTPLLNDRGDIINDVFREKLLEAADVMFNADYAAEMRPLLKVASAAPAVETESPASS